MPVSGLSHREISDLFACPTVIGILADDSINNDPITRQTLSMILTCKGI
jgi:hypothetical protein